jgi:hypothetical protein
MRIIIGLILFITFSFSKILIVNSYDEKDQCGVPQLNGFLYEMYNANYNLQDFDIYFLNARVTPKKELLKKAQNILKNINKYKYIITFDDAAFKLVGIPASKAGKIVIFSGMNYPYEKYKKQYNLKNNIGGVFEKLYAKEILTMFNKIKPINKIAIFYSDGVGNIVKNQIAKELKNSIFEKKLELIHIDTLKQLKHKTKQINKDNKYTLFIPLTLSLKNEHKKVPFYKIKDIYLKNIKKPDFGINIYFIKLGFLGFGGVDFFKMGRECGKIFLSYKKTNKLKIVNAPKYHFYINSKRAKEINFKLPEWFVKNYLEDIIW